MWTMMIALSIASWFTTARIVRGQVHHPEGERLRARRRRPIGARWYRVLCPAPAAEHARRPDHRRSSSSCRPSSSARRSSRSSGSGSARRTPRGGSMAQDGRDRVPHPIRSRSSSRRSRSHRSSSAPTSSQTASATRSTPDEGDVAMALLEVDDLRTHFFTRDGAVQRRRRRQLLGRAAARRSASSASRAAGSR